jgi:hypothetical protein
MPRHGSVAQGKRVVMLRFRQNSGARAIPASFML